MLNDHFHPLCTFIALPRWWMSSARSPTSWRMHGDRLEMSLVSKIFIIHRKIEHGMHINAAGF